MTGALFAKTWIQVFTAVLTGTLYWGLAAAVFNVEEPWDAPLYWPVLYPISLGICAAFGARTNWRPAVIGLGVIFPQVLMIVLRDPGMQTITIGGAFGAALSLPAILAAWSAARITRARHR